MSGTCPNPIEYFRLKSIESKSAASVGNMTRAIDSLSNYVGGAEVLFSDFDDDFLGEWIGKQFYDGYYARTVAYNISKIAALYNKAVDDGLAEANDSFATTLTRIKSAGSQFDGVKHSATFQCIQAIYRANYSPNSNNQLAKDIVLFGIFNGGLTLEQIADYKKGDYVGDNPYIKSIVEKYSKPKNKYLFPLNQAYSTKKRLLQSIQTLICMALNRSDANLSKNANWILVDMWSDVAMGCGVSASEIAGCISHTGASNALTFCVKPAQIDDERISRIRLKVQEALTENPVHWYAMHLRRHTKFSELTDRLQDKGIVLDELFYPMEEIIRKTDKKMIFENRPVISWLIFYRARVTQLNGLFHEVGDLAWGYRYSNDVKSPYAVIPDNEVLKYQQAIGTLSPSMRVMTDEEVKFKNGDYLVVLGGSLNGRHGVFLSEKKGKSEATGRIVYRIQLAGGNNVNWEVNCDPLLVKKISEEQYRELDVQFQGRLNIESNEA